MKRLTYVFAALPLLAIAAFYLFSSPQPLKPQTKLPPNPSKTSASVAVQKGNPLMSMTPAERMQKYEADKATFNAKMIASEEKEAQLARSMDVPKAHANTDRSMDRDEPAYRKMLDQWGLADMDVKEVLSAIRQARHGMLDALIESLSNTAEENGDRSDRAKVTARTNKSLRGYAAVQLDADAKLLPILGPERLKQLKDMEAKMRKSQSAASNPAG